jgi:hypothetical protein
MDLSDFNQLGKCSEHGRRPLGISCPQGELISELRDQLVQLRCIRIIASQRKRM